jgi:hypothetical protein
LANKFLQEVARVENLLAEGGQHYERLIKVVEQKFASLDATEQKRLTLVLSSARRASFSASCALLRSSTAAFQTSFSWRSSP